MDSNGPLQHPEDFLQSPVGRFDFARRLQGVWQYWPRSVVGTSGVSQILVPSTEFGPSNWAFSRYVALFVTAPTNNYVILELPDWLNGENPAAFGADARWTMSPVIGKDRSWEVRLQERVSGQSACLIQAHRLLD